MSLWKTKSLATQSEHPTFPLVLAVSSQLWHGERPQAWLRNNVNSRESLAIVCWILRLLSVKLVELVSRCSWADRVITVLWFMLHYTFRDWWLWSTAWNRCVWEPCGEELWNFKLETWQTTSYLWFKVVQVQSSYTTETKVKQTNTFKLFCAWGEATSDHFYILAQKQWRS